MVAGNVAHRIRSRFNQDSPFGQFYVLCVRMVTGFAAFIVLILPQHWYAQGSSLASAFVGPCVLGIVLAAVLVGAHWLIQLPMRDTVRLLGFTTPKRWWIWIPVGVALGVIIRLGVRYFNLPDLWPALVDVSPEQLANNQARDTVTDSEPAWLAWTHAAGEEVAFRAPVVAFTVYAFGRAKLSEFATVPRSRLAALVFVAVAMNVCFGLAHLDYSWLNVVTAWLMGAACVAIAIATRSVWPAAALHAAYNTPDLVAAFSHLW